MVRDPMEVQLTCWRQSHRRRKANQENPQPISKTDPVMPAPVDLNQLAYDVSKLQQQQEKELVNIAEDRSRMLRDAKLTEKELIAAVTNSTRILGDIAKDSGGKYVPNVQAIQQDRDSRQDLVEMVMHDSTRSSGKIVIRNDMSTAAMDSCQRQELGRGGERWDSEN